MMYRPAKAYLCLSALKNNLKSVQAMAPDSKVLAVIKANGYGHGIERVAHQLSGADAFGVASIDEAMLLRQKGFLHRILLLEGLFSEAEIPVVIQNRLDLVVHSQHQLNWLLNSKISSQISVWVKVDTGMHRLGFEPKELPSVISRLQNSANEFCIHIMSHFSSADEKSASAELFTQQQIDTFEDCTAAFTFNRSLANSAGIMRYPLSHYEWVRPGITLYGAGDIPGFENHGEAVMQLESEIISIKNIPAGESVGYANTWTAQRPSTIGVIAIGYGDGYPRHAPSGTPVLINGQRVPLVGRVSMDMITVDLTDLAVQPQIGDCAVLWGKELSVDEIARFSGTIGYELLCGITKRVPMIEVQ
ncbi:alanine racemase 1 [Thiomicrorhabdus immobilis]|uniref:Alanine racemase n=1 Tax=Thiomicrorhabdus immobilis TaxID=2791037 RepID=A0ABM7MD91_9GAMM|nr:alanine racemase [Thiomicrorhabdus immobilis]BCN93361.1 alanine racemase 1 [Thiomicrorhabdus immobilis]